jgi:rSAM/selenodomain-associated transferase 1
MDSGQLLIVFVRNLQKGNVKTRIARTMGEDKALEIYKELLLHTFEIAKNCTCAKKVYYSKNIEPEDIWQQAGFEQEVQSGDDLGAKMYNAFASAFDNSYREVILIGSDCLALNEKQLLESFEQLQKKPAVIGPATDGGFYLIGLKNIQPEYFLNKSWSHDKVFEEMKTYLKKYDIVPYLLPTLSDIDVAQDWINR